MPTIEAMPSPKARMPAGGAISRCLKKQHEEEDGHG